MATVVMAIRLVQIPITIRRTKGRLPRRMPLHPTEVRICISLQVLCHFVTLVLLD